MTGGLMGDLFRDGRYGYGVVYVPRFMENLTI